MTQKKRKKKRRWRGRPRHQDAHINKYSKLDCSQKNEIHYQHAMQRLRNKLT